jgi:hypothetical protein
VDTHLHLRILEEAPGSRGGAHPGVRRMATNTGISRSVLS